MDESLPSIATGPLRGEAARRFVETYHGYSWDQMTAFPKHVDIDTINTCNARCTMCGIDFDRRVTVRMSDDLFAKIVGELAQHRDHVERVGLVVNSEPLMDRRVAEKVAALKRAGMRRVSLITNASLLSRRRGEELLQAGIDMVYISIDSLDPATFERIRRGLSFDTVYGNIREFLRVRQELRSPATARITMVQSPENDGEADEFVRHWSEFLRAGDQVVVTRGYNWGTAQGVTVPVGGSDHPRNQVPCAGLWTSLNVEADGKVRMCCADQAGETCLGDLNDSSIEEVWHGAELARLQGIHLAGERTRIAMCDGCPIWSVDKHLVKRDLR